MTKKLLARILLFGGLILLGLLFAWEACADDLSVVEVRTNIPLNDKDPVYHDYYINSGTNQGLKHNLVVTAIRKITVRDSSGTQSYGDMLVPVGQLKIIMVGEKFAVAREIKQISRDEQPMLEQTGIMIGDKVELKGSFVDNHKIPSQKTAENAQVSTESSPKVAAANPVAVAPVATAPAVAPPAPKEVAKTASAAAATTAVQKVAMPATEKSAETSGEKPEGETEQTASTSTEDSSI